MVWYVVAGLRWFWVGYAFNKTSSQPYPYYPVVYLKHYWVMKILLQKDKWLFVLYKVIFPHISTRGNIAERKYVKGIQVLADIRKHLFIMCTKKLSVWHNDYIDSYSRYVAIVTSRSCIINFMNTSIYSVHRLILIVYMSSGIKLVYCATINVSSIAKGLLLISL